MMDAQQREGLAQASGPAPGRWFGAGVAVLMAAIAHGIMWRGGNMLVGLVLLVASIVPAGISIGFYFTTRLSPRPRGPRTARGPLFVAVGCLLLIPLAFFPIRARRAAAIRMQCAVNLRRVGMGLAGYASDWRVCPADLVPVARYYVPPQAFVCPGSQDKPASGVNPQGVAADFSNPGRCSYVYVGAGVYPGKAKAGTVLAYDRPGNHGTAGIHVLLADGQVKWVAAGPKMDAMVNATARPVVLGSER